MKSQKQAVFDAVKQMKGSLTGELTNSEFDQVSEVVAGQILDGTVAFSDEAKAKYDTTEKVLSYTRSMVRNHMRKSPELNGGFPYTPSFRRGPQGNAEIKELKKLAAKFPDNEDIKAAIAEKEAAIVSKKQPEIKVDLIPENLRHLLG